ncbi:DUF418 domain-containing protein [Aurantiacibacter gilvus]|uniref:DUF418 domain-containing protein n=1 Tax=Aurantiacibacter gilvus TaxID=3139141 RepID=A0ABU9IDZ0_9SPHN
MTEQPSGAAPVTSSERVGELDVLRGFALLGVLIANFVWWSFGENTALPAQTEAFAQDPGNLAAIFFTDVFVSDKANTLFAFLFGVGFWVQMQRLEERGAEFGAIYTRRLFVLLVFGLINLFLIWPWDILNLYAITGFLLFALRGMSARAMLWTGLTLALLGMPLVRWATDQLGWAEPANEMAFGEVAIATRQDAYVNGSYFEWVEATANLVWFDWIANGLIVAWILYALGRFLVGAYVARQGWLQRAGELLPQIRKIFLVAFPLGVAIEVVRVLMGEAELIDAPAWLSKWLHVVGVPILDLGYAAGLILLFHSSRFGVLARVFGPVGRMALTNYLVQGVFIGLVLYGFHGGLALAGMIEPKVVLGLCFGFYALQTVFSHWWLGRYRFGPMEWLWRTLTYGERPTMRAQSA